MELSNSIKLRSYFVKALIASLVVAAGAGILALLIGTFDIIQIRILLTTLLIGIYSIVSLCCMAVFTTRYALWGLSGIIIISLSLLLGLVAVWVDFDHYWAGFADIVRYFAISGIVGISIGHQSLLLRIVAKTATKTRSLVYGTVSVIGIVASLLVLPLLFVDFEFSDLYWRLLGVLAILDVLGTIVVPIMSYIGSRRTT